MLCIGKMFRQGKNRDPRRNKQYKEINGQMKGMMFKARENWLIGQCNKVGEGIQRGNMALTYRTLKRITNKKERQTPVIKDEAENLIVEEAMIRERERERDID